MSDVNQNRHMTNENKLKVHENETKNRMVTTPPVIHQEIQPYARARRFAAKGRVSMETWTESIKTKSLYLTLWGLRCFRGP
jgi:hypothetical protein